MRHFIIRPLYLFFVAYSSILILSTCVWSSRSNANVTTTVNDDDDSFKREFDELNRLRNSFLRNGMNVFSRDTAFDKDEEDHNNNNNNRNRLNVPADELLLLNVDQDETSSDSGFGSNINIIQGDIIVPPNAPSLNDDEAADDDGKEKKRRKKRRIITNSQFGYPTRWPNRTIPYEFDYDAS